MRVFFVGIAIVSFVISCTHFSEQVDLPAISFEPPRLASRMPASAAISELEALKAENDDQASQWWLTYRQAKIAEEKGETEVACSKFTELGQDLKFPLQDVASLRAELHCDTQVPLKAGTLVTPQERLAQKEWLIPLVEDQFLERVKVFPDTKAKIEILEAAVELDYEDDQKEVLYSELLRLGAKFEASKESISQWQEGLYEIAPRLRPAPRSTKEDLEAARDHRKKREFEPAIALYKKAIASKEASEDEVYKALNDLRMTYKIENQKAQYIQKTKELADFTFKKFKKKSTAARRKAYFESHTNWARAVWTEGRSSQAVQILRNLASHLKDSHPLAEVYWLQARIREERGRYDQALYWLDLATEDRFKMSESLKDSVYWHKAWSYKKQGEIKKTADTFQTLVDETNDPYEVHRYRYWLARSLKDLGQTEKAQAHFEKLTSEDSLGYYGMLSFRELNVPIPTLKPNKKKSLTTGLLNPNQSTYLKWLISLDEKAVAVSYLEKLTDDLKPAEFTSDNWVELLSYYAQAGEYLPLFRKLGSLDEELKTDLLTRHPDYLFPQPFRNYTKEVSEKAGVSEALVYSIMRQESAFDPKARSHADAFGLLQLLPSVAKGVAERHEYAFADFNDLYDPRMNILLGGSLLSELMTKYDNQFVLAVASYNASESAIQGWLNTRLRQDPTEFIEDIPYEETKNYVKLVLRNFILYQRLLTEESTISFPEWCLEHLHRFKT